MILLIRILSLLIVNMMKTMKRMIMCWLPRAHSDSKPEFPEVKSKSSFTAMVVTIKISRVSSRARVSKQQTMIMQKTISLGSAKQEWNNRAIFLVL